MIFASSLAKDHYVAFIKLLLSFRTHESSIAFLKMKIARAIGED